MSINKAVLFSGIIAIALVIEFSMTACSSPADSGGGGGPPVKIDIATIQGVTAPATGGTPITTITPTAQYTGKVTWNGAPSTFAVNTQYRATITLTPKTGYTLKGVEANFFIVAGAITVNNNADSGVITAVFPMTDSSLSIISTIQGVTIPAKGEIPVTRITENEQYTGTVTWSPNHPTFVASTEYTATITLAPRLGYTLQGVTINYFTVDGAASVSNAAHSGVITATFPSTDATTINIAVIQGVTIPTKGEIPVTRIIGNEQYSGTVTWSGNPFTFAAVTQYTATIMLTPKSGYTLHGVSADFFTVEGAVSVSNNAHSGDITAIFPATAPTNIILVSISITAPVKGATPHTTAIGSNEEKFTIGSVSWLPADKLFLGGTEYTAEVTLTANSVYTFTELSSATINGQNANVSINTGSAVTLSHTFPVTSTKIVTDIAITTQPEKLTYTHSDTFDLAGLTVTLTHDDTTTEKVAAENFAANNITANPAHGNNVVYTTHNKQPVKITYGDLTCDTRNLIVNRAMPTVTDFNIGGTETFTYNGNPKTVTIAPKEEKSNGTITVKYNGDITAPSVAGIYIVTFDVAEARDFSAVSGLSAGTLTIEKATPIAADFTINGTESSYYDGNSRKVIVTPKEGKSTGTITVKYNGSTTAPSAAGTYTVTFDVAEAVNYKAVTLSAGTLTIIANVNPTAADFTINGIESSYYDGNSRTVTITRKEGKSTGIITVYYEGTGNTTYTKSITAPSAWGTYAVTFNVTAAIGFNAASGLSAGTLMINPFTSISDLNSYLRSKPNNTASTPYIVALNVSSHNGNANASGSLGYVLNANYNKYINIDLSGSTFTSIGINTFQNCTSLTGVIIGNSVTSIGGEAFFRCTSLTSVIFEGTIAASSFSSQYTFESDLREKFYALNPTNGTPGTYIRASGDTVWTKL